ncbi:unnamed protein product [Candida verbasci]|uniref:Uncharacterized protein n=1 Tax=Candida verbasci TaxID=1227364 RepID=A0A9W4X8E5_9ASCO|nr:unnamed protein product [Candida verbasci]
MSNIASIFNPPPPRDFSDKEIAEQCLSCTTIQSLVGLIGGFYLSTSNQFKDKTSGKIDFHKNPLWWQKSVKGLGVILFGLGAYRAGEVLQILYNRKFEKH